MIWDWKESMHPIIHILFQKDKLKYGLPKKGSIQTAHYIDNME